MSKKLAIKGHPTRGNEVIELLEMMGGKISYECTYESGFDTDYFFFICEEEKNSIDGISYKDKELLSNYICFTLEEFLAKYPFKVGDKVVDLKSGKIAEVYKINWSENNSRIYYDIKYPNNHKCQRRLMDLEVYKEEAKMKNVLAELLEHIKTTPKEELERELEELEEWSNVGPTIEEFRAFCECVNKKPKYPATFEECLNMLYCKSVLRTIIGHKAELLLNLEKLLVCRDAYWKIAGEQMGLNKLWEPDWNYINRKFYCIYNSKNNIVKNVIYSENKILAFPTEEMRDAFYENFKDLIEKCKELL